MKLGLILNNILFNCKKDFNEICNIEIYDIAYNSSLCSNTSAFVALKGQTVDGHNYANNAYDNGCRVFILESDVNLPEDCIKIFVSDTRKVLSRMSANFFGNPSRELTIIGVTGTKGKTTITNYISTVLNSAGINTGVIGTNGTFFNGNFEKTINTTPESYELHRIFKTMLDNGVKCVAMEVSSGGLMMDRVSDVDFDIALFSNISPDHIGPKEHPTFEHYLACKSKLFELAKHGVINRDDKYSEYIIENATCKTTTFSIKENSDLQAVNIQYSNSMSSLGVNFDYILNNQKSSCQICSPGEFSLYNALAVIAVCNYMGIDKATMTKALLHAKVDGRVQVLPILPYATTVIDYAHNGVSLENILTTLRSYKPNRLICLFGSVGGRTKLRRKELGDIASKLCDLCILTSDNPDYEEPLDIIADIAQSFKNIDACDYIVEPNRELAVRKAIQIAESGDIILFAGKGHEKYQLIKGEEIPFNEASIAEDEAKRIIAFKELNSLSI